MPSINPSVTTPSSPNAPLKPLRSIQIYSIWNNGLLPSPERLKQSVTDSGNVNGDGARLEPFVVSHLALV